MLPSHAKRSTRPDQRVYLKLLPYQKVRSLIQHRLSGFPIGTENVSVQNVVGRICAEDRRSTLDTPPLSISAMDGYAIRSSDTKNASSSNRVSFEIQGAEFPGNTSKNKRAFVSPFQTYYVETGSPIPQGADTVVRVEETLLQKNRILLAKRIPKGKNISFKGEDVKSGSLLFEKGRQLNSVDLALAMSANISSLCVSKIPLVGILSIGDDLRTPDEKDDGRLVTNYANLIQSYLSEFGASARFLGVARDDPEQIGKVILTEMKSLDMLITIAGSSVGARDCVIDGLRSAGASIVFHGVKIVPLRPAGLATLAHKPVAIVPGHGVSASLSFFLIVLPILNMLTALPFEARQSFTRAIMGERLASSRSIDSLYLVQLRRSKDTSALTATPLGWGSNLLLNLSKANGFILLRANEVIDKGREVPVTLLGSREISRLT